MKKGISLVALVVTIVVLLILTTAVILNFQDGGIIDKANQAVEDSNEAVLEEKITMMNLEYTQKLKKKFTPKTRETLKAIVKQSGIDLDKLLVYYDVVNGEQHVFYKIDKVTKSEVEWFLENEVTVEIDGVEESKKIYWLFGDVNFDGEHNKIDIDLIQNYVHLNDSPELPQDNYEYCWMVGDINGDHSLDSMEIDMIHLILLDGWTKIIEELISYGNYDLSAKEEQVKTYFGIE